MAAPRCGRAGWVRAAELGGTGQTAVPVPPQTVQHHPPTPAIAPRSPTSQRSQDSPLCPGLFLPWESRVSSCRPTRHVASGCRSRSLISAWGSACGAGSWSCRRAPYLDTPRTETTGPWDSARWVGSGNRDRPWAPTSHLPKPASLSLSPHLPHSPIPTFPITPLPAGWPRGNLPVPGPCLSIPLPEETLPGTAASSGPAASSSPAGRQLWGRGVSIFSCLQWDLAAGRPLPWTPPGLAAALPALPWPSWADCTG